MYLKRLFFSKFGVASERNKPYFKSKYVSSVYEVMLLGKQE